MKPEEIDALKAGPELDALIAREVMGEVWDEKRCRICGWPLAARLKDGCVPESCALRPAPSHRADDPAPYSTELEWAWKIVDKEHLCVHRAGCTENFYWVGYPSDRGSGMVGDSDNETLGTGETAPLAICRSALKILEMARHLVTPVEEQRANARLIAAAPTMLEALEAIVHWMSDANIPCCFPRNAVLQAIETAKTPESVR